MSVFYCAIPVRARPWAMSWAAWSMPISGWRAAFMVAGLPGILLALLALTVEDPAARRRGGSGDFLPPAPAGVGAALRAGELTARCATRTRVSPHLRRIRGLHFRAGRAWPPGSHHSSNGFRACLTGTGSAWLPGVILVVTDLVGTFAGGWIGDRMAAAKSKRLPCGSPGSPRWPRCRSCCWPSRPRHRWCSGRRSRSPSCSCLRRWAPSTRRSCVNAAEDAGDRDGRPDLFHPPSGDVPSPVLIGALSTPGRSRAPCSSCRPPCWCRD